MGGKKNNRQQAKQAATSNVVDGAADREASAAEPVPETADGPGIETKPARENDGKLTLPFEFSLLTFLGVPYFIPYHI